MDYKENELLKELDLLDFPYNEVGFGSFEQVVPNYNRPIYNCPTPFPNFHYSSGYRRFSLKYEYNSQADLDEELFGSLETAFFPDRIKTAKTGSRLLVNHSGVRTKRGRNVDRGVQKKRKLLPIVTNAAVEASGSKYKVKQKRTKWLRDEVQNLWEGIALHGNNWRLIKKMAFGHRTYYQVKDKGRRILSTKGWSSGRTKATHDGAAEEAKIIADKMLVSLGVAYSNEELISDTSSKVGSTGSPDNSDAEFDFEFDIKTV